MKNDILILKKIEYSNTIEIYDSIPKYLWNKKKYKNLQII